MIDVDATLVTAHSEKEQAAPTFRKGFGFHPLWAFADHGPTGTGEPLSVLLRKERITGCPSETGDPSPWPTMSAWPAFELGDHGL